MNYDDVFQYIGQFGRYQKFLYLLICLPMMFSAIQTFLSVFILHVPFHRCNDDSIITKPMSVPYYVPRTGMHSPSPNKTRNPFQCEIVEKTNSSSDNLKVTKSYPCTKWTYDTTSFDMTYAMQKNLVCDRKHDTTFPMMLFMAGFSVGSLLTGISSDAFGRKKTLMGCIMLMILPNIAMSFVENYNLFSIIRFLSGFSVGGLLGTGYVIGVEMVGPTKRIWAGIIFEFFWSAGEMLLVLFAYFVRHWKYLNLVVSIPPVIFLSYFWILPESPRWLLLKGRTKEAENILQKTAKLNKANRLPQNIFEKHKLEPNNSVPIWNILKYPKLILECFIIMYNWMMTSMVFYGLGMNSGNMGGNIYLNFFMQSLAEVIGFAGCMACLHKIGRKPVFIGSIEISGVACLATFIPVMFLGKDYQFVTLVLATIGKIGASSAFAVLFLYSGEIFPTVIRNTALGIGTCFARAGGMAAPYMVNLVLHIEGDLGRSLPLVIFGASSIIAGILSFYLPETKYKDLPESIEDWLQNTDLNRNRHIVKEIELEVPLNPIKEKVDKSETDQLV